MATSGSTNYSETRATIVQDAFRAIGIGVDGESLDPDDRTYGERTLNRMLKSWDAHGDHLWKREEIVVFLTVGTEKYQLGSGGDRACLFEELIATKLNGAHSSSDTALTIDSSTGMAASDVVGVVVDDGSIHWTTISSVDSSTQITIASGLDDDAADDSVVYTYTNVLATRPKKMPMARRRDHTGSNPQDTPLTEMLSRQEYMELPNKKNQGIPSQAYYDPQLSLGEFYVWPAPESSSDTMVCTVDMPIEDLDSAANEPDLPQEWFEALVFGLARRLMTRYPPQDPNIRAEVREIAASTLAQVLNFDSEGGSIYFKPSMEG